MGLRIVEKEFVFIRAVAVFRNRFILPPGFICCALASHPYSEIMRRLFNVKLEAHIQPFLALRLIFQCQLYDSQTRNGIEASSAGEIKPGANPALLRTIHGPIQFHSSRCPKLNPRSRKNSVSSARNFSGVIRTAEAN